MDTKDIEDIIKEIFGDNVEIIRVKPKTSTTENRYFDSFNRMKKDFEKAVKDINDIENCNTLGKVFGCIDYIGKSKHANKQYVCEYIAFAKRYKSFIDIVCNRAISELTKTLKSLDEK